MKEFEIYRRCGYLDLVAVVYARTYEEAEDEARRIGYDPVHFRIQEVDGSG